MHVVRAVHPCGCCLLPLAAHPPVARFALTQKHQLSAVHLVPVLIRSECPFLSLPFHYCYSPALHLPHPPHLFTHSTCTPTQWCHYKARRAHHPTHTQQHTPNPFTPAFTPPTRTTRSQQKLSSRTTTILHMLARRSSTPLGYSSKRIGCGRCLKVYLYQMIPLTW
jgi:hypothetical protein